MEKTIISKKILINQEQYREIGWCSFEFDDIQKLYDPEYLNDKLELLANLNEVIEEKLNIVEFNSISSILYALKIISDNQLNTKEFTSINEFILTRQNELKSFIDKWWNSKANNFYDFLNLNDLIESEEPQYIDIRYHTIIGLHAYSDVNEDSYFLQLCDDDQENANQYVDYDDIRQCYILASRFEELIVDLNTLFKN